MSYFYNGTQIRVSHPVHSISVNHHNVVFADRLGCKKEKFASLSDAKAFIAFLVDGASSDTSCSH